MRLFSSLRRMLGFTVDGTHPRDPGLANLFRLGPDEKAGISVDHNNVMALPAVMRAVSIISNGVAKVPFYVFKQQDGGESQTWDRSHPSWTAIVRKPNTDITAGLFRQTMTAWALRYGNAVAYIHRPQWPNPGEMEFVPLMPDRTKPIRISQAMAMKYGLSSDSIGKLYYQTRIGDKDVAYEASECLHIRGLGDNPHWGYDVVDVLRESLSGAMAAQEFGHRFYGQGANPAGFIEMPTGMEEEAEIRFLESIRRGSEGMGKAHRLMLLEEGAKFHKWTTDPDKAQFLEGKQFDIRTIAMAIGIKVHKLIDSANSSYNSLEQANQEHKDDDLMPWICRWREEMDDKLLTEEQKRTESHRIDIDDEALEWVPFSDRARGVVELYNNGLVTKDEGRRRVNFGPSKAASATRYRKPANIEFEDEVRITTEAPKASPPDDDESQAKLQVVTAAYLEKIARRIGKQASAKASKGGKEFLAWLDALDTEDAPDVIQADVTALFASAREVLGAVADSASEDVLSAEVDAAVAKWLSRFDLEVAA